MKTWFVTGISRGLGLSLAKAILARGDALVGTVRGTPPSLEGNAKVLTLDTSNLATIPAAIEEAFAHTGRIDVIVNNAGYGLLGALETATDDELDRLFRTDLLGPIHIIRAALPKLRAQRAGHIINVTSIAGRAPGGASSAYSSAKGGLEILSAALAQELKTTGIRVTAVAPGAFRTDFLAPTSIVRSASASYNVAAMAPYATMHGTQAGDPDRAARALLQLADDPTPPVHLLLGSDALQRTRDKLAAVTDEMARYEALTRSTDFT
ncbi:MAG: SDR family NAD(P)-dependent oxidoreductase [Kofleriaceae bacterium]